MTMVVPQGVDDQGRIYFSTKTMSSGEILPGKNSKNERTAGSKTADAFNAFAVEPGQMSSIPTETTQRNSATVPSAKDRKTSQEISDSVTCWVTGVRMEWATSIFLMFLLILRPIRRLQEGIRRMAAED